VARQFNLIPPICEQAEYHMFQREKVEVQLPELFHKIGTGPRTPSVPQPTVQEHMSCSLAAVPHAWICCWDEKVIFWGEAGEKTIASLSRGSFSRGLHPLLLPLHPLPCAPATSALAYLILAPQAGFPAAPPCPPSWPLHPSAAPPQAEGSVQSGQVTLCSARPRCRCHDMVPAGVRHRLREV